MKDLKVSLQVSMLGIFLTLFIVTMLSIMALISWRFYDSLVQVSKQQMSQVSAAVSQELRSQLHPAESAAHLTVSLIQHGTVEIEDTTKTLSYTLRLLRSLPVAAMSYYGDIKGNFVIARLQSDDTVSSEIINRNAIPATSTIIIRDKNNQKITSSTTEKVEYDPRKRPWYLTAVANKKPTWSDPYVFYSGDKKTLGITFASPIYQENESLVGVYGIDMRLDAISTFLGKINISKTGTAFIVDKLGNIIAHPKLNQIEEENPSSLAKIEELNENWLIESYHQYQKHKQANFRYEFNGETYLASYSPLTNFSRQGWSIAVVIPENDFVGPLKRANTMVLTTCLIILILGGLIIMAFSRRMSSQVGQLVTQTEKIRQFDLADSAIVSSHIKEINHLAKGIVSMRSGLRAFQKYVPADLVRKLIKNGVGAKLGGKKTEITIMFSDIHDFTSISEALPVEKLMMHLCTYFDKMSKVINEERGTIDKFIGDAIMAFWNSPVTDKQHCKHALNAALRARDVSKELSVDWQNENIPALATRFGIHTGDAIVGNIGASDRLNYTAIGDTINIASRLEEINKVYDTQIIVSEKVVETTSNDFIFRTLDCITVKGKKESTKIFELLCKKTPENIEKYQLFCDLFNAAFTHYQLQQWDIAIQQYQDILTKYPNDQVARLFIKRCQAFKQEPPAADWDGVWRYTHK